MGKVNGDYFCRGMLTNDIFYHMLTVIIIMLGRIMLHNVLGSGWGVLLAGLITGGLMFADLSLNVWKVIIAAGLLMTSGMIWHKQLRHFVLLPSCAALVGAMLVILTNLK